MGLIMIVMVRRIVLIVIVRGMLLVALTAAAILVRRVPNWHATLVAQAAAIGTGAGVY